MQMFQYIYELVRGGHRKVAGQIIEENMKHYNYGFNNLHKEASIR